MTDILMTLLLYIREDLGHHEAEIYGEHILLFDDSVVITVKDGLIEVAKSEQPREVDELCDIIKRVELVDPASFHALDLILGRLRREWVEKKFAKERGRMALDSFLESLQ